LQFPPIASSLATQARNSFVEAGVSTLINLPLSVAQHVTSKAMTDRIDAQSKMPGAEKKNVDGTKSTVDPSATDQQKIEARLEGAEIKTELLANCSGLMKPDTHLGENARQIEVSDDQTTPLLYS
jgi:hypothetical protein